MPAVHLKYGGSTATRTLNCPAWVNLAERAPDIDRTSPAAERGTMLHDVMEAYYDQDGVEPIEHFARDLEPDDFDAVMTAYNAAEDLMDDLDVDEVRVENMVTWFDNDQIGGSADLLMYAANGELVVLDWKFGHQPVTEPHQFLLYAVAALDTHYPDGKYPASKVTTAVIQPEVSDQAIVQTFDTYDLTAFEAEFTKAVETAESGTTDGNPGSWCKYCPAEGYCPAKRNAAQRMMRQDLANDDNMDAAAAMLDELKEYVKGVEREMLLRLENGLPVKGFKLVAKQARRHWIDSDNALAVFKKSPLNRTVYLEPDKLRTPAQIEKAIKAAGKTYDPAPLITKSSSGTTFAPTTDKRPAIEPGQNVPAALDKIISGD